MSKRNENRPGYKKTKAGWIPEEWECIRLKNCTIKIGSGITPRGGEKAYVSSGVAFIRSQNVLAGSFLFEGLKYITLEQHKKMKGTVLRTGDVLFNITGASIGRGCLFPEELGEANLNQHVCIIRSDKAISHIFLALVINSPLAQKQLYESQAGGGREGLNFENLGLFKIPLPPIPEQKKIATILSSWNRAIELVSKLINAKNLLKKGLMQQLLTGRMRYPEFGKPVQKKGELPVGWKKTNLGDMATVKMGTSPSSSSYNNNGQGLLLIQGNADIKKRKTSPSRWTTEITTECFVSDLVMTVRAPVGEIAVSEHHACIGRGACVIKSGPETDNIFLFQLLISTEQKWNRFGQGSTFTCLTGEDIRNYKFAIPNLREQTRIAAVLSICDWEIELLRGKEIALREQKKGLMQNLLTGEVRVKSE